MTDGSGDPWRRAMLAGDFEAAWRRTDALEADRRAGAPAVVGNLVWDGSRFEGRQVLVRCLHGLGDTLQFARFVPAVAARAAKVDFLVQPSLIELLHGLPGLGDVSSAWTDEPPPCDMEIEVMELAYALRCHADALPPPYPHLRARARDRTPPPMPGGALRVGLLWAASEWDPSRSLSLRELEPLFTVKGASFFGMQQGDAARDPRAGALGIFPLWRHTAAIADAAAAMARMDLVITVDGMPAHLAGTLGVPTWLLLKHDADWRWMRGRDSSPWYPSMRLFRQPAPGAWHAVVLAVADALQAMVRAR